MKYQMVPPRKRTSATPLTKDRKALYSGSSAPASSSPMNVSPPRILNLPLEEGDGKNHQHNRKSGQDKNIRIDARESGIFQEQRLERVNRIGERIDVGNPAQPNRKSLHRINGSRRKVQQSIQHAKHSARHEWIADANHQQKHETDHGHRSRAQHNHKIEQPHRIP